MGSPVVPEPITPAPAAPAPAATPAAPAAPPTLASRLEGDHFDAEKVANEMIEERGGGYQAAFGLVKKLLHDNKKARSNASSLRRRVVSDGDVVLKANTDDRTLYDQFRALGVKPDEIKQRMAEHAVLQQEVKRSKQMEFLNEVADAIGIPNKKAFVKLAERSGIAIELRDVQQEQADGSSKVVKLPFARLATAKDGEWRPLDVYLDEEEGEFRSALYADAEDSAGTADSGSGRQHAPAQRTGVPMTPQRGSARRAPPSSTDAVKNTLAGRYSPRKAT